MAVKITRIDACRCLCGEGPVWDEVEQALYFLDIGRQLVHRYEPSTGSLRAWNLPEGPGAMALRERGGAVVAMKDTVYALDLATGVLAPIVTAVDQPPRATFNDGKVDRQGRFIIGSCETDMHDPKPIGGLYSLEPDGRLTRLDGDITYSNSPCFSPDGRTLYISDSAQHTIFAYPYDPHTSRVGERRVFADTQALGGMPDGATVDREGRVWVAIFGGGKVAAFTPEGALEQIIDLPVSLPGSVMFGGRNLDQLYVVTIDPAYFGNPAEEGAGYTYVVDGLGVRGLPEPRFAG
jgi:sugar lactone lactonase YvrE